ncbi:MAG: haloalkane dehalogenase [Myxococcota bacterium]
MRLTNIILVLGLGAILACGDDSDTDAPNADPSETSVPDGRIEEMGADEGAAPTACTAEAVLQTAAGGIEFVRTPDECFEALPDWPYEPEYVELDGLRQAYVDEGPADGPVVLLLHGQPTWSYLYRHMIPVLVDAGFRVIAMDHLGMGRSDKPTDIESYSYLGHADRLLRFMDALALSDIHLFVQDWGSLIGLRVAGLNTERFARIAVGNGALPVVPAGFMPFPAVADPNAVVDLPPPFPIPDQQPPFYEGCEPLSEDGDDFGAWMTYSMKAASFRPSEIVEALTWFPVPEDVEAAYDAPFPSRVYMAGVRVFPSLINDLPGLNADAWAGLSSFTRPFLTIWAENDPGTLGSCDAQQAFVDMVPGAAGWPAERLPEASHFLQDDQGEEIARRLAAFFRVEPTPLTRESRYCELLLVRVGASGPEAEVWGTQGTGTCPQAALDALDIEAITEDTGALSVVVNGPRHWIPNATEGAGSPSSLRLFGELPMIRFATVTVDPSMMSTAYTEATVLRTTTYTFDAGEEVYELSSPEGATYVMQSLSLITDPTLTFADLPMLGERLTLPTDWSYTVRTLDAPLVLDVEGEATVLTDDLGNTYQRSP